MRRRLTPEEKEIRSGRGIGLRRFWAFPVLILVIAFVAADSDLFSRCVGDPLEVRGKGAAAVRMALVLPCSPYLLAGSASQILKFVALWFPVPFIFINRSWAKRHKAYWDVVRTREKRRRAERRSKRVQEQLADETEAAPPHPRVG